MKTKTKLLLEYFGVESTDMISKSENFKSIVERVVNCEYVNEEIKPTNYFIRDGILFIPCGENIYGFDNKGTFVIHSTFYTI